MESSITIGLDYSHNNILILEASSYADFTNFLFTSGYKIGKIEAGFDSLINFEKYNTIILSTPKNVNLGPSEIENLVKYVENGGTLLIFSSSGSDYQNKTNLNELTRKFGFEFLIDEVNDSMNYVFLQKRPILTKFKPHYITEQVKKIVFSSTCSIKALDFIDDEKNVKIEELVRLGLNGWHKIYDGEKWIEEDSPKIPLMIAVQYYKGKVVAFGNSSIFSSLGQEYGFSAFDNDILIANIIRWLTLDVESKGKVITAELNLDMFYWGEEVIKKDNWSNFSDLINVSLKYFKDNYDEIIESIKKLREEKLAKRKAHEKAIKEDKISEEIILEKIPEPTRKREDLEDIMSALEEITGEKYEFSIDFEEDDEEEITLPSGLSYTNEDVLEFEKGFPKKAIWHGKATKTFKAWLKKKYQEST
ncbi:MAG: hypothetical protein ACFFA6_05870 [Promethearchaeota archaeon]